MGYCMIAAIHAGRDLEQEAAPCECEHCRRECACQDAERKAE